MTRNVPFIKSNTEASSLRSTFIADNPELFQSSTVTSSNTKYNGRGAPIRTSASNILRLPGSITGTTCQENVPVLFGVNRDVTCVSSSLCTRISEITSILSNGEAGSSITPFYLTKSASTSTNLIQTDSTLEYYFQNNPPTVNLITSQDISINDYCLGRHPTNRTQRYFFCNSMPACTDNYRTYTGCPSRPSLTKYAEIPSVFFNISSASTDDGTDLSEFTGARNVSCKFSSIFYCQLITITHFLLQSFFLFSIVL